GSRTELGPERVHQLLPVQPMRRCEREELDEPRGLAAPPRLTRDCALADRDRETAEQLDPQRWGSYVSAPRTALRRLRSAPASCTAPRAHFAASAGAVESWPAAISPSSSAAVRALRSSSAGR